MEVSLPYFFSLNFKMFYNETAKTYKNIQYFTFARMQTP